MDTIDDALASMKQNAEKNGVRSVSCKAVEGVPSMTIVDSAEQYDLIVIGTHGRTGLKHIFLGSVAENVVRRAPCPVLTVRFKG